MKRGATVSVHDDVVPRGHDFAVLLLRRVPRRRDVAIGPVKHHEQVAVRGALFPERVAARDMSAQRSERRRLGIDEERNVVGDEPGSGLIDEGRQRILPQTRVQHVDSRSSRNLSGMYMAQA